jgi:hypothetical protein
VSAEKQSVETGERRSRRQVDPAARASLLGSSVVVPRHVVRRAFANETVVLNLQTGTYHGLNPTGARMLEALERCPTVTDAAAALAREYGMTRQEIEDDLCDLCIELLERGLLEPHDGG